VQQLILESDELRYLEGAMNSAGEEVCQIANRIVNKYYEVMDVESDH
jgi:hypothetical protein